MPLLRFVGETLFRAVALTATSLFPLLGPLEVTPAGDARAAWIRGCVGAAFVVAASSIVLAARRRPLVAWLTSALLVEAIFASAFFRGARGPLAVGVWMVSPVEWCLVAAAAAETVARRWLPTYRKAILAGLTASAIVLLVALFRIRSRGAMWESIASSNPGNEEASLAAAESAISRGDRGAAINQWSACARANVSACACAEKAADALLFDDRTADVLELLDSSGGACGTGPLFGGLQAEAFARTNRPVSGVKRAEEVLATSPHEPHALYAQANAFADAGGFDQALPMAIEARDSGAIGTAGTLLVDRILIGKGDFEAARADLMRLPRSAPCLFLLAEIDDRLDRYHDAREGYLAALHVDPRYAEARYRLALLTLRHGAQNEAKYNLDQFAALAPNDPRLQDLRRRIETP